MNWGESSTLTTWKNLPIAYQRKLTNKDFGKPSIVVLVESRFRFGRLFELQTIASAKFNRFSSKFFFSSSSLIFVLAQTLF